MSQSSPTATTPLPAAEAEDTPAAPGSARIIGPVDADAVNGESPRVAISRSRRHTPPPERNPFKRIWLRVERKLSELSTRSNFWHRLLSFVFLPLAYRSGIKFKDVAKDSTSVVLPFRRFNKNWYRAMAGAALLGNSEVAGGMYVFGKVGPKYTVVCKEMSYKFLRPCFGPAIYKIEPREDVDTLAATGEEFNLTLDMVVVQAVHKKDERERRVGHCVITFHVTPKTQHRARSKRRRR